MSIPIITVATQPERTELLRKSAEKQGWELHIIQPDLWRGFGTKLIETYNYLKAHPEIESFVFCDAYDVVVLGSCEEFEEKLTEPSRGLWSAERGCWPDGSLESMYKYKFEHGFNYLNSGLYYISSIAFIQIFEAFPPQYAEDDQLWFTTKFLNSGQDVDSYLRLDNEQSLFNSHSFIAEGEYTYNNNRVQLNGNEPIFIHFNGRTVDEEFNKNIVI